MDCFGTYFTHAQSCDNVRVHSATEWTASIHTLHMPKGVIKFVFEVYGMACWRTYLTHAQICDHVRVQSTTEWIVFSPFSRFRRFRVFVFSRFRAWRFRVFAFSRSAGGTPAAGTHISCAQLSYPRLLNWWRRSIDQHGLLVLVVLIAPGSSICHCYGQQR